MRLGPRLRRATLRLRPVIEVGALVFVLGLLPFSTCVSQRLFHLPCPGCGMTRAVKALALGHWRDSLAFHPLALPLLLGLGATFAVAAGLPDDDPRFERWRDGALRLAGFALGVVWVARLAGVLPRV